MKLAIVFDVPDDNTGVYADVAARMIQHHAFAEQQAIKHWSFDLEMRPVAALVGEGDDLVDALRLLQASLSDDVYAEAVREDWARGRVAAAGKSWATHLAKFDGTVLER
jgi:hypothetical protein